MKKIFLAIFIISLLFSAAPAAFANSGGDEDDSGGRALSAEEKRLVGNWTEKGSKTKVSFMFWDSGKGYISFGEYGPGPYAQEGFADADVGSFSFDAETSEYVMEMRDSLDMVVIGRAKLVEGEDGQPEKLIISGSFIYSVWIMGTGAIDKPVTYSYELVRESDLKSAKAPDVPGSYSIGEVTEHWIAGDWRTLPDSGGLVEMRFSDDDLIFLDLFNDDGNLILETSNSMQWDDNEKAFRIVHASSWMENGELQTAIINDFGWLRPSAGENARSETMYLDFNCYQMDRHLVYQSTVAKVSDSDVPAPAPNPEPEPDAAAEGSPSNGTASDTWTATHRYITFGEYNGHALKWRVLEVYGDETAFLVLDGVLRNEDGTAYTTLFETDFVEVGNNFPASEIFTFLNDEFLNSAFTAEEQAGILTAAYGPDSPPESQIIKKFGPDSPPEPQWSNAESKIFLLSVNEAENPKYFRDDAERNVDEVYWLRSPGVNYIDAPVVWSDGGGSYYGYNVYLSPFAVRPALKIDLSSPVFTSEPGYSDAGSSDSEPEPEVDDEDDEGSGGLTLSGSLTLSAEDADLSQAPDVIVEGSPSNLGGWFVSNKVTFHFDIEEEGDYLVTLLYSKQEYDGDRADLQISAGEESASAPLPFTGEDWSNYVEHEFCTLSLPAGVTALSIESTEPDGEGYVMNLRSVNIRSLKLSK